MATFTIYSCILCFFLLTLHFLTLTATPDSSFSHHTTLTNNPNFDPEIAVLGDAQIVNGGSHVQLARPFASNSGLLFYKKPFNFIQGNLTEPTSFSTKFSFSLSPGNGDGLSLVLVPYNFASKFVGQGSFGLLGENKYLAIEFDSTKIDDNVGDLNANHVRSLVSVSVSNVSSVNSVLNNGEKLESCVDYDSSSKILEIRLSKFGEARPVHPILVYNIDLLEMLGNDNVFWGLVSTNSNSSQTISVYSWIFRLRKFPNWMHSLPADPRGSVNEGGDQSLRVHKRSFCPLKLLAALIFAAGCGASLAFMVLFAWAIFVGRQMVFPVESPALPVDFRYEKISVVVEKESEEYKN